ncbi:hypothetical protein G6F57_006838 [Rhizopus arrhizus]|jgi:hypothetical protein|uniref:Mediator complex subunit 8 n=3 Tax=Rhizopus TaxID=4842 RepID=I1CJA6_RHIO9|nr:hypothetical protein RO3G_13247 [Rhizopus delemar RA 99-880]KAG0746460.1 hypothetical protein G6F23_003556 [Rhizopus arrhizus]KAG1040143.1 hypothetical protein G6F43_012346 [Rhizopus delemar]KAG0760537.1 hypothetical protein G6F24_008239 [Rhizopus arrhizus]KAG0786722.1 hypothetical protein G6F21_008392 [Rhizopus arrhizus]|eukprot:EIE88536.1 hypothetical protein RO3G_13247 [Rhizopus delemar RA 99-880]
MQAIQLDPNTYQELETLRNKLWSLQETFATHITYLKEPKYPFTWPDLLNKFNMLTAKFASLSEDFYRYTEKASTATLPKLMLHPYIPTTTEQETNILSVLLRTKLIPDIEKLEAETQAAIARDLVEPQQEGISNTTRIDDEQLIKTQLDQWTELRSRHDRLAVDAAQFVAELSNDHKSNFLLRYEDQIEEEEEEEEEEQDWEKMGFPNEEIWKKWKLECLMNFYSSGKSEVVGSDLKKLATAVKK